MLVARSLSGPISGGPLLVHPHRPALLTLEPGKAHRPSLRRPHEDSGSSTTYLQVCVSVSLVGYTESSLHGQAMTLMSALGGVVDKLPLPMTKRST